MDERTNLNAQAERPSNEEIRAQLAAQYLDLNAALGEVERLRGEQVERRGQIEAMEQAQGALEHSRNRYMELFEYAPVGYLTLSTAGITHINETGAKLMRRQTPAIVGHRLSQFILLPDRIRFARLLKQVREHGGRRRLELELERGDKTTFHAQLDCVKVGNGAQPTVLITVIDITERKQTEVEIRQLAFYDPLTSLPNRRLVLERLEQALLRCSRKRQCGAVLLLDLDDFKALNDAHGHAIGDLLLKEVGHRLTLCVRALDTAGRLGGDEFVVILEALDSDAVIAAAAALKVGEKIMASLGEPYLLGEVVYQGYASMGITVFEDDGVTVERLLSHADVALYRAKSAGHNTISYFSLEMQERVASRSRLLADLRQGLQRGEMLLHFQPQIDKQGSWAGVEALLRWQHPRHGLLLPEAFLSFAEEQGLMEMIGGWVFQTACTTLERWSTSAGLAHLTMAMNVSAYEFRQPQFAARVEEALDRTEIDPRKLMLEFTEGLLFSTMEETRTKMQILRARGIRFAVDDFGIGYSSLVYLQSLPLDQLKIDQSLVRNMIDNHSDAIIVRAIIALAQNLGLDVVAEGVETHEQYTELARHGCAGYQGFLFGRPVPEEELLRVMASYPIATHP